MFFPRVREQREDDVDTVVQPDVLVVCDPDKLVAKGIWGAPDLVRMNLVFEWNPQKEATNLNKHGVSFAEATGIFVDPFLQSR